MRFAVLRDARLVASRIADYVAACTWRPRRWAGIDPQKEALANESDLKYGLTSRSRIILERGDDPEEIARERDLDEELFGELPGEVPGQQNPAPGANQTADGSEPGSSASDTPSSADSAQQSDKAAAAPVVRLSRT